MLRAGIEVPTVQLRTTLRVAHTSSRTGLAPCLSLSWAMPKSRSRFPIKLIPEDDDLMTALKSAGALSKRYGIIINTPPLGDLRGLVQQSYDFYKKVSARPPWIGYLTVSEKHNSVRGCCGFKGNPGKDRTVEIAYFTFPDFEGKGFATGSAQALVEMARASDEVDRVLAHTLPQKNSSGSVLKKSGFDYVGEVTDPEDGLVWRWEQDVRS